MSVSGKFKAWPLALAAWVVSGMAVAAPQHDLLVGSYTRDAGEGIYLYRFDAATGRLQEVPYQTVPVKNPSWLALSKDGQHVYAVSEVGTGDADPVGRVNHLSFDAKSQLGLRGNMSTLGDHPTHASLSADGRYLFVSNYSGPGDPGGTLAVLPVAADGQLGPVTQIHSYQASGKVPDRQMSAHVHSAVWSPDGRHLAVSDLGGDRVYVYRYDPGANAERPLQPADPAFLALPPGSGPRHLVFDASGQHAYLTLEMTGQVAVLDHDDGRLSLRRVVDLAGPEFDGGHGTGAIHLSDDGRFLYTVNRGDDNHLYVFAVDPQGDLSLLQRHPTGGRQTREFTLDPSGRFLLVANQGADAIGVIARDPETGLLSETVQTVKVTLPAYLEFIPSR